MKKMSMNTNKSILLSRLGVLAMAGMMLGLGGCASTSGIGNQDTEALIKAKNGIVYAVKSGNKSIADVCETFAAANDERCKRQDEFNAYLFLVKGHTTMPVPPNLAVALVPKAIGDLKLLDVAKLRLDGFRPAFFELLASRGGKDDDCLFITNYPGASGVTCPKYNWDFRKDLD